VTHDEDLHARIATLEAELHTQRSGGSPDQARIAEVERELDQAWDLQRQRDAKRHAGLDPDDAQERPQSEVEGYLNSYGG